MTDDPVWAARALIRGAAMATLATSDGGQPFASLVTPATAGDGTVLMLLSGLSPHTRHLRAEPRCSLLFMGERTATNPQTAPRITLLGTAAPELDPRLKARWVARHPYAAFYADLGDFQLWRVRAEAGHFIGGFASAHRLRAADLMPDPAAAAAIGAAERFIIDHGNRDHPDALSAIAGLNGGSGEGWRMVACDPDGFDLAREQHVLRVQWPAPVAEAGEALAALIGLARAAPNPVATAAGPGV